MVYHVPTRFFGYESGLELLKTGMGLLGLDLMRYFDRRFSE
jgi:hypothetical protein